MVPQGAVYFDIFRPMFSMISVAILPKMQPAAAVRWKPYLLDLRFQLLT
jgi:hypothetical protein